MSSLSTSRPETGDMEQQLKTLRAEVAGLADIMKGLAASRAADASHAVHDHVDNLVEHTREMATGAAQRAKSTVSTIEDYIVEKPVQSALIALLVGIVIGSLGRR